MLSIPPTSALATDRHRRWERFRLFNEQGGKFRVGVVNACNLDCFFCHNEAMSNPRAAGVRQRMPADSELETMLEIVNTYTAMGGRQVNITGGEPLALPQLPEWLGRVNKRRSRLVLNSNVVLADRLLSRPRLEAVDEILASLHTTDDAVFQRELKGRSARAVMDNIVALSKHGYSMCINYSLGDYNKEEFPRVLEFAYEHKLFLKAIALVRHDEAKGFYGGRWVAPTWLTRTLEDFGATPLGTRNKLGGRTTTWAVGDWRMTVKNIADGRLVTDFCGGCPHARHCGEGVYGVRVGVDGLWKPCLLRRERFGRVDSARSYEEQILDLTDAMIGDWSRARFRSGAPA